MMAPQNEKELDALHAKPAKLWTVKELAIVVRAFNEAPQATKDEVMAVLREGAARSAVHS